MKNEERNDLIVSWLTLSLAFSLIISENFLELMDFAEAIPISLIAVGTGFVFHEMAHRQAARHYGFHAEYRAWKEGLIFAVLFAFISGGRFTFAAPGATYIFAENISVEKNGKISVAGPVTNVLLGFGLLLASLAIVDGFIAMVLFNAGYINFWFAFFNLLPIGPLDGTKVLKWNKGIWIALLAVSAVMVFNPKLLFAIA